MYLCIFCAGLLLDYGPNGSFYASKTFFDAPRQQRVLWGWSKETVSVSWWPRLARSLLIFCW